MTSWHAGTVWQGELAREEMTTVRRAMKAHDQTDARILGRRRKIRLEVGKLVTYCHKTSCFAR